MSSAPGHAEKQFVDVLKDNGRPVTKAGLERARAALAAADARLDPAGRAQLLDQLRADAA